MAKVFLSHHYNDAALASRIEKRLRLNHGVESYLDVVDPYIDRVGEDLASHLQNQMGTCTQLLAIVSDTTRHSQWVPWEIGVVTEKEYPLATFSTGSALPPEFLRKWPYLRTDADIDAYARASKLADSSLRMGRMLGTESLARGSATADFYTNLRSALGQR